MSRNNFIPSANAPFEGPEGNAELWRYMDFVKFVSLLSTQSLWFSSAASFEDPFEGAIGLLDDRPAHMKEQIEYAKQEWLWQDNREKLTYEGYLEIKKEVLEYEQRKIARRKTTYINCWYESPYESMAMWQLYSKDNQNAVAIRSSARRIKESLPDNIDTRIGRVNYIDYASPTEELYYHPYWFKSFHFAHENEVRVVPVVAPNNSDVQPSGMPIQLDLNILIACVYISPWAQPWFFALIKDVCKKYGLEARVTESAIAQKPLY